MCVDPGKVSDDARWRLPGCPDVQAATGSPGASGSVQAVRASCCLKVSLHLVAKVTVLKLSTFFFFNHDNLLSEFQFCSAYLGQNFKFLFFIV